MENQQHGQQIYGKIDEIHRQCRHAKREFHVRQLQKQIQNQQIKRQIKPPGNRFKFRQPVRNRVGRFAGHNGEAPFRESL